MANEPRTKIVDDAGQPVLQPEAPREAPRAPRAARERRYLVLETAQIPRGGSHFTIPKGKIISSQGYDIDALKRQGVKLEEAAV